MSEWRITDSPRGTWIRGERDWVVAACSDRSVAVQIVADHGAAARLQAAQESESRLRAALTKYGCHTGMCGCRGYPEDGPTGYHCVCGLYDLVDEDEFVAALASPAPSTAEGA